MWEIGRGITGDESGGERSHFVSDGTGDLSTKWEGGQELRGC